MKKKLVQYTNLLLAVDKAVKTELCNLAVVTRQEKVNTQFKLIFFSLKNWPCVTLWIYTFIICDKNFFKYPIQIRHSRLLLCRGIRHSQRVSKIWHKTIWWRSSLMLELWRMQSAPSLPSLLGPRWPQVVTCPVGCAVKYTDCTSADG